MAAGSISENKFQELAAEFENISRIKNDLWELRQVGETVFLVKRMLQRISARPSPEEVAADLIQAGEEEAEVDDPACLSAPAPRATGGERGDVRGTEGTGTEEVVCEYHVVYSPSYQVPVLYFNITRPNGRRLCLEEIWECVPQEFQHAVQQDRWSTLTQQEHPVLCVPFFQLHPCKTATMMTQSADVQPSGNYLVRWLSAVGPVVGLHLPLSFGLP